MEATEVSSKDQLLDHDGDFDPKLSVGKELRTLVLLASECSCNVCALSASPGNATSFHDGLLCDSGGALCMAPYTMLVLHAL